jgi:hypothetical protein
MLNNITKILVYANSCAKCTPATAVAIHQLHNLFSTFLAASCQLLRPPALGICRGHESLHYVKVVIIITEDVHASNSISLADIVPKIMQLQVQKPGCMWGGQGLTRLRSRLWLLRLLGIGWLGQRETGLWLMWVLAPLHPACMWQITAGLEL